LLERGVPLRERNIGAHPLTVEELDELIGDRPVTEFLHPGSDLYRERKMAENPPSREEAIRLMAEDPNLILRPVIRSGVQVAARPDEATLAEMAGVRQADGDAR
jgi:arsenate reductase-like glutaredoxin family protein